MSSLPSPNPETGLVRYHRVAPRFFAPPEASCPDRSPVSTGFRGSGSATHRPRSTPLRTSVRPLGIELWIKRDDCTGLALGGNKVRQLEFYLGEAQARGADTVLITGAVQSNFVRLAAAGARQLGMDIHIQLEERVDDADALYRASGNVLLDRLLGATMHSLPSGEDEAAADAALGAPSPDRSPTRDASLT